MKSYSLYLAWVIACFATLGSLYVSEVLKIEPCHLCWYQRICVFPLVILLGLATYNSFYAIIPYVMPLVVIGLLFAVYQVILQETSLTMFEMCGTGPSCTEKHRIGLGGISMPILSAAAQGLMLLFLSFAWPTK